MNRATNKPVPDQPFNDLPLLPPGKEITETNKVLRQTIHSSIALGELKGVVNTLPNPEILLNAVILREAKASSEIENVITTQDKLYQALSAKSNKQFEKKLPVYQFDSMEKLFNYFSKI